MAGYAIGLLPLHTVVLFDALLIGRVFFASAITHHDMRIAARNPVGFANYEFVMASCCGTIFPEPDVKNNYPSAGHRPDRWSLLMFVRASLKCFAGTEPVLPSLRPQQPQTQHQVLPPPKN